MTATASPNQAPLPASESPVARFSRERLLRDGYGFMHRVLDFGERRYHRALGQAAAIAPAGAVGGLCGLIARLPFTPEQILLAYAQGVFPMETRGKIFWHSPDPRCVLPLDQLHVPSRIARYCRSGRFELCFDRDAPQVLSRCGDRTETWLSPRIQQAYLGLFELGALHTSEAYVGDRLVGGAFGVSIGRVFTIESMFGSEDHASKLCFAHLCRHLATQGYDLADCQYQAPHVERFGAIEMSREDYRLRLARGLAHPASFGPAKPPAADDTTA